jgi:hypothetical protein
VARAAAKRKKRTPPPPGQRAERSRRDETKSLEQQLFFGRLRRSAKWAFLLLAIVFAGSFVFLGVGSGNAGLGDVFQNLNIFGSSGSSISKLEKAVKERPNDATARNELAQALVTDQREDEAVGTLQEFLDRHPRNVDVLNQLAAVYDEKANDEVVELQLVFSRRVSVVDPAEFGPAPDSALGRALGLHPDPISKAVANAGLDEQRLAEAKLANTRKAALEVYRSLAVLNPEDSTRQIQLAQAAENACLGVVAGCPEGKIALAAYRDYVRRFPDDPLVPQVKQKIAELEPQVAAGTTVSSSLGS